MVDVGHDFVHPVYYTINVATRGWDPSTEDLGEPQQDQELDA